MEQALEPSADVDDNGVSISLDKIGIRIRTSDALTVMVQGPLPSRTTTIQVNLEKTVWSVEQARRLVFHLRRAIDALANPT